MKSENFELYHEYLRRKSFLGSIYRKLYLFPKLSRETVGRVLDVGCGTGEFCSDRESTAGADINPLNINLLGGIGIEDTSFRMTKYHAPQRSTTQF